MFIFYILFIFLVLDASLHLYKRPCPSDGPLVGNAFVNLVKITRFTDSERGGSSDDEEGAATKNDKNCF